MRFIQGDSLKEAIARFHADEPLEIEGISGRAPDMQVEGLRLIERES